MTNDPLLYIAIVMYIVAFIVALAGVDPTNYIKGWSAKVLDKTFIEHYYSSKFQNEG